MAKGYVKKIGIDFEEVFALVARIEIVIFIFSISGKNDWPIHHLDVKLSFLNGVLEKEVYITQPKGYIKCDQPKKVYKLSKALYRFLQAPTIWNSLLDKCLKGIKFVSFPQE